MTHITYEDNKIINKVPRSNSTTHTNQSAHLRITQFSGNSRFLWVDGVESNVGIQKNVFLCITITILHPQHQHNYFQFQESPLFPSILT
jgi:hypothetical protein